MQLCINVNLIFFCGFREPVYRECHPFCQPLIDQDRMSGYKDSNWSSLQYFVFID